LIAILLLCLWNGRLEAFRNLQPGDPAPPLVVEDLNGDEVSPSLTGKLTVLLFWRAGQSRSLTTLKEMVQLAEEFERANVEILAIADGDAEIPELIALEKQQSFPFPLLIDRSKKSQERYGIIVFPSTGIIAEDGRLQYYQPDQPSNYGERIAGKLKVLLGAITEREFSALLNRVNATDGKDFTKAQDYFAAGMKWWDDGKREAAVGELTQAIALSPGFRKARLQLGYLLLELGDAKGALKEFRNVKDQSPHSPSADMGIGIAYLRLGESEVGIALLEKSINTNPNPVWGYAELGRAHEAAGDLERALFHYKRAISKLQQGRK